MWMHEMAESNAQECFLSFFGFFPSFLLPLLGRRSEGRRGISIIAILHGLATTAETRKTSFYESSKKLRLSLFLLYVVVAAVEKRFQNTRHPPLQNSELTLPSIVRTPNFFL